MAASLASCEVIWLRKLLVGLFNQVLDTTEIHCDNQSYIKLSENPMFHDRSKHIEIRYHFIQDCVQKGSVKLQYVLTDEQIADILTKPLVKGKFVYFRDKLGVVQNNFLAKRDLTISRRISDKGPQKISSEKSHFVECLDYGIMDELPTYLFNGEEMDPQPLLVI
jgi:hypothetical protein